MKNAVSNPRGPPQAPPPLPYFDRCQDSIRKEHSKMKDKHQRIFPVLLTLASAVSPRC